MVRDAVIKHLKENTAEDIKDAESMFSWINADLDNIKEVAENVVQSNGYTYKINTVPGTFLFPQKNYGKFSLPAGDYRALRIVIGEGIGNNWFCILFPPLCFTGTAVSYDAPKENTLKIISDTNDEESSGVKIKFKIAEFFGRIHNLLNSRINISKKK
jgi:stage II sporulation protein R